MIPNDWPRFVWKLLRGARFGDGGGGDGGGGGGDGGGEGDPGSGVGAGGGGDPGASATSDAAGVAAAAAAAQGAATGDPGGLTTGGMQGTDLGTVGAASPGTSAADTLGLGMDEAGGRSGIPATTPAADFQFGTQLGNIPFNVNPDTLSGAAPASVGPGGAGTDPVSTDPAVLTAAGLGNVPGFPLGGAGGAPTASLGVGDALTPTSVPTVPGSQAPGAGDIAGVGQPASLPASFAGYNTTGVSELGNAALAGALAGGTALGIGSIGQSAASTPTGAGTGTGAGQQAGDLNALQAGSLADIGFSAPPPNIDAAALSPTSLTQGGDLSGGIGGADPNATDNGLDQMFSLGGMPPGYGFPGTSVAGDASIPLAANPGTPSAPSMGPGSPGWPAAPGTTPGPDVSGAPAIDLGNLTIDTNQPPPDPAGGSGLSGSLAGALGAGGAVGRILSPGFPGFPGAPGGVELAGGGIQLPNGAVLTSDQIAGLVQQQDTLLQQWEQVIPPGDPRWPQVVAMVQQQVFGGAQ